MYLGTLKNLAHEWILFQGQRHSRPLSKWIKRPCQLSRKSAAAASTALSIAEFIDNYPGMPEGARAAMLLLKLDIISFLNYAWREVHNKMLLCRSIALDCLESTLPPIDEDQKLAFLQGNYALWRGVG